MADGMHFILNAKGGRIQVTQQPIDFPLRNRVADEGSSHHWRGFPECEGPQDGERNSLGNERSPRPWSQRIPRGFRLLQRATGTARDHVFFAMAATSSSDV